MRAVVQRIRRGEVTVENKVVGQSGPGLIAYIGVKVTDTMDDVTYTVNKISGLRIFEDDEGKMNRSVLECQGSVLAVSQFTLYGDARHGRRPSFIEAARPEKGQELFEALVDALRKKGLEVATGQFGAHMMVDYINDGPVTILIDSEKTF